MMPPLRHEYVCGAYSNASRRHIIEGMRITVPMKSNRAKLWSHVLSFPVRVDDLREVDRKKKTMTDATAPIGRLTGARVNTLVMGALGDTTLTVKAPLPGKTICKSTT